MTADPLAQIPLRDYLDDRFRRLDEDLRQLKGDVKALETSRAELAGKADQHQVGRAATIAYVSLGLALLGLIARFMGV